MDDYQIKNCVVWDGERALSADEAVTCLRTGPKDELHRQAADTIERLQRELKTAIDDCAEAIRERGEVATLVTVERRRAEEAERERDEARAALGRVKAVLANRLASGNEMPVRRVVLGPCECSELRAALGGEG